MRESLILRTSAPLLLWSTVLFSLYILLRGHNAPGGGFIGGLIASVGLLFYGMSRGQAAALRVMRMRPTAYCATGMILGLSSGVPALTAGEPFLTHFWWMPEYGPALSTALVFDVGVYLAVIGTVCAIFLSLIRD